MATMEQLAGPEVIDKHWLVTCSLLGPTEGNGYFWFVDVTYIDPQRDLARWEKDHSRFGFVRVRDEAVKQATDWCAGIKDKLRRLER